MEMMFNVILLIMLLLTAIGLVRKRSLFAVVMLSGIYSLLSATLFIALDAVDVAFTEAAVGAGISTVLMLGTLALTTRDEEETPPKGGILPLLVVMVTGSALLYATIDMPNFGDPMAPIHHFMAPHYVEHSGVETGIPNIVTSVLASYRGYDTMGETTVILTATIGILAILGRGRKRPKKLPHRKANTP
ncbi:MAG: DUF4040 domain-containing protein [Magnetococcales bacterium]|nr:DUF4040 domain-containing protein [Magnetococcales bacterium]